MNLSGETGLKTSLQGKSMRVELGKRSFHPSDAFFDMDNLNWFSLIRDRVSGETKGLAQRKPQGDKGTGGYPEYSSSRGVTAVVARDSETPATRGA
jgi:hypothetical protein